VSTDPHGPADHDSTGADAGTLTAEELRVLACLIEKANTTPEQYPLSTNALTAACNQKTSREPVVDYPASLVDQVMQLLRDGGWARSVRGSGNRTFKHRHIIDERLGLDSAEQALIAVLALRGPQSPGELKTRTERYHPFADLDEVESVLDRLAGGQPPLVRDVGRGAGQSQNRWIQLIGPSPELASATVPAGVEPAAQPTGDGRTVPAQASAQAQAQAQAPAPAPAHADTGEVEELRSRVDALERRLADLERELGLEP